MNTNLKIAVTSGRRMDQGKTSVADNLVAPRVSNLVRIEIESASTGSAKEGVLRISADKLPQLRMALLDLEDDQSLVCDVGGSEYANFMTQIAQNRSTAAEFDRFIFVMRAGGIKEADALESITELIEMGADPSKLSVLFNFAEFIGRANPGQALAEMRQKLRAQFPSVFEAAQANGFHVCETPIAESKDLYATVFTSKKWTIDGLADAPDFKTQIKALKKEGKDVPEALYALYSVQDNARSFGKANLDAVWAEIMAASKEVA